MYHVQSTANITRRQGASCRFVRGSCSSSRRLAGLLHPRDGAMIALTEVHVSAPNRTAVPVLPEADRRGDEPTVEQQAFPRLCQESIPEVLRARPQRVSFDGRPIDAPLHQGSPSGGVQCGSPGNYGMSAFLLKRCASISSTLLYFALLLGCGLF